MTDLVHNLRNLGVGRGGGGGVSLGGLPSPRGRPSALGEVCGRDAHGGRAEDVSAASSCGLRGDCHGGGLKSWRDRRRRRGQMGLDEARPLDLLRHRNSPENPRARDQTLVTGVTVSDHL